MAYSVNETSIILGVQTYSIYVDSNFYNERIDITPYLVKGNKDSKFYICYMLFKNKEIKEEIIVTHREICEYVHMRNNLNIILGERVESAYKELIKNEIPPQKQNKQKRTA